jgi:hypothetical protein
VVRISESAERIKPVDRLAARISSVVGKLVAVGITGAVVRNEERRRASRRGVVDWRIAVRRAGPRRAAALRLARAVVSCGDRRADEGNGCTRCRE